MNQSNCIIIHGCPSTPNDTSYNKHWIPWAKKELQKNNIPTQTPNMPTPWQPNYENFKKTFEKLNITEKTVLVGHSCGTAFLIRWLGETKTKIKKLILVAPWKINDEGDKHREEFYTFDINPEINSLAQKIAIFTSDTEEVAGKKSLKIYKEVLNAKIIEIKNYGHFTQNEMKTIEFPQLINKIIN